MSKIEDARQRTVWIAYEDDSYEGCSEPLAAFSSKFLADIWLSGADAARTCRCKVVELPMIGIDSTLEGEGR